MIWLSDKANTCPIEAKNFWLKNDAPLSLPSLKRPVRLRARTPPFHGGDTGSNPVRATKPCIEDARLFLCEDANQACLMERLSIKKAGHRVSGVEALGTSNANGNIENNPAKAGHRVSGAKALGTSNAKGNIENNPVEKDQSKHSPDQPQINH